MSQTSDVSRSILTPLRFLERSAAVYPDKVAVVHGEARFTYAEFAARCHRLASALRNAGIERGDRVAILCPNIPPMLEAHFGVPAAGGVLVAINTRLSSGEVAYIINHCGAKLLVVDTELAETIRPVASELEGVQTIVNVHDVDEGAPLGEIEYEEFVAATGAQTPTLWPDDERETIAINYTSGTTGRPKGVMYSHRGAYLNALGETLETDLTARSVYLWTLPMFHCNGWCFTWGVTGRGATNVCLRRVDPAMIWSLIEGEGVTHLNGAPIVLTTMLNHPDRPGRLARPLTATLAGAPPSPTLLEQMQALGARSVHAYGLTETYGPHTVCAEQEQWNELPDEDQARPASPSGCELRNDRAGASGRRCDERRAARRSHDGRGRHARRQRDEGLLQTIPKPRPRPFGAGGFTAGISPSCIPTGTSSFATVAKTSSSPAARMSLRSRSNKRSADTTQCSRWRS